MLATVVHGDVVRCSGYPSPGRYALYLCSVKDISMHIRSWIQSRTQVRPWLHWVLCAALLLGGRIACAQALWPSDKQWEQIRVLSASNPDWRTAMLAQRRLAAQALQSEPNPLAGLTTAGRLRGDPLKAQTELSLRDMEKIQALAIAYRVDQDLRLAERAGEYLLRWATVHRPSGQPIDETGLEPALFGYRLVRAVLSAPTRESIDAWIHNLARAAMASRDMKKKTATNNWHSHRLKLVGLAGFALDEQSLIAYARQGLRVQIGENLLPSGESIDFRERDALAYHVYDLRPLVTLALAFAQQGEDFYHWKSASGSSLAHSVAWLKPYLRGEKTHPEFVGSTVRFDKARSDHGERGHVAGTLYEPRDALPLLILAAAYDPECAELASQLGSSSRPEWRLLLSRLAAAGDLEQPRRPAP